MFDLLAIFGGEHHGVAAVLLLEGHGLPAHRVEVAEPETKDASLQCGATDTWIATSRSAVSLEGIFTSQNS